MSGSSATRTTIEQQRAAHALAVVQKLAELGEAAYGNYVSYVSALPAQMMMNGLGQALATLMAAAGRTEEKAKDAHYLLYSHVARWLITQNDEWVNEEPEVVIDRLVSLDQAMYFRAQVEALAYLNWLKKFARAILDEKLDQGCEK